eukprot:TRINITY_DN229_c0_g1_i1.p1 TRINITY_DN229_c0_g1~~TRINITY_DN229_c0_g1_i1.p1  ORF type:complete len:1999 (+),score=196.21 TRINITY_DN229_c0_g1_i1:11536-17532(+)
MNQSGAWHDKVAKDRIVRHAHLVYAQLTAPTRPSKPPYYHFAEGEVFIFASYLLQNPQLRRQTQVVNNALSTALIPYCWPSSGLPALREAAGEAARNGVCGRVWKEDELAYKCKTCERDPSCVICVECFRNGNHEGHDYAMLRINGGCCDCGDDQAWDPIGFCCNHKGACSEHEDLSRAMGADLRRALIEAVTAVAVSVFKSCAVLHEACRSRNQTSSTLNMLIGSSYAELVTRTTSTLTWLNEVVCCGDGIRRAVGLLLTSTDVRWSTTEARSRSMGEENPSVSWLDFMFSMDGTGMLPEAVLSSLHSLYFELITDVVYRRIFLEKFAKNYPRFIHAQIVRTFESLEKSQESTEPSDNDCDIVGNFTVQLFTVPALVPVMIQDGGLLEMLLRLLCILFESTSIPIDAYRRNVPFDQTNYAQRCFVARNENPHQHMNAGNCQIPGSVFEEGEDGIENTIGSVRQSATQAGQLQTPQREAAESHLEENHVAEQDNRETLQLVMESETVLAPVEREDARLSRSDSDVSANDDDIGDEHAITPFHRLAAFEAGVQKLCPSIRRAVRSLRPNTRVNRAVILARSSEKAALGGEVPLTHTMRLDWSMDNSLGITDMWTRVMADLNYVLSHPEVAFHVVHRRPDLFRLFVRIVSMFQGMHPLSRRMGDHVPTEPSLWFEGFRVEIETYHLAELIVSGFCANENKPESQGNTADEVHLNLSKSRLRAIRIVRKCLDEWLEREEYQEALSTYAGEFFTVAHAISVHLPLHRLLALFVHHAMRIDALDLPTALSGGEEESKSGDIAKLLVHPLRIQAFLAQERAKMWRRNGRIASIMSAYCRYPFYSEWYVDLDIFLQQCCAASMQTSEFVSLAMKTFRIKDVIVLMDFINSFEEKSHVEPEESVRVRMNTERDTAVHEGSSRMSSNEVTGVDTGILPLVPITFKEDTPTGTVFVRAPSDPKEDIANFAPILLDGLMTYFVHITSERCLCGQSKVQNLRRKLLHLLCSQDRTHSQLSHACVFRVSHTSSRESNEPSKRCSQILVDQVISSIADYVEPKKMEQGRYTLKDDVWKEFDPFLPQYAVREKNAAEVRHAIATKRRKSQVTLITDEVISARPFWRQFEALNGLSLSLCEQHELSLATILLREALKMSHPRKILTTTCAAALHLLCLNVETVNTSIHDRKAREWLSSCCHPDSFQNSPLGILYSLARQAVECQRSVFSDLLPVFTRIIRESYKRCSLMDRPFLERQIPQSMRSLCIDGSELCKEGDLLKVDEERRRKLQAKRKEKQAAAMRRMRIAQANFAKLISEADEPMTTTVLDQGEGNMRQRQGNSMKKSTPGIVASDQSGTHQSNRVESNFLHKCALCHEARVSDETGPLGYIGFRQNTKLPFISKDQGKLNGHSVSGGSTSITFDRDVHKRGTNDDGLTSTDFVSTQQKLIHLNLLKDGVEQSKCVHISLCSHVIHMRCFEGYFSSLLHSSSRRILFEGFNVVNLQRVEFLCPVCRRLANLVLPCVRFPLDGSNCESATSGILKMTDEQYSEWLEHSRLNILKSQASLYHVDMYGSMGRLEWGFHEGVCQASLPFKRRARDVADPHTAGTVLRMLERFQVSLESYSSSISDAHGQKCRMWTCSYGLPVAVTSTIACAEILARSYEWRSSSVQTTRRSLPKLFACARAQFYMSARHQDDECRKAFQGLWNLMTSEKRVIVDPFVALSYLVLMWPTPLTAKDVSCLIRVNFECLVRQSRLANSSSTVTTELVVYLRRVSILYWCVLNWREPPISSYDEKTSTFTSISREVGDIAQYLNVPSIQDFWAKEANHFYRAKNVSSTNEELVLSSMVIPKPVLLKRLPSLFQTLLESLNGSDCSKCSRVPKNPALCLVCGTVLCGPGMASMIEIGTHADVCGAGIGVFLLLKEAKIYILRGDRSVVWGSPYLDPHGEEDESLRRGTPLLLNKDRYSVLEQLWLCHGFDQDPRILVKTQRTSSPHDPILGTLPPVLPVAAARPRR